MSSEGSEEEQKDLAHYTRLHYSLYVSALPMLMPCPHLASGKAAEILQAAMGSGRYPGVPSTNVRVSSDVFLVTSRACIIMHGEPPGNKMCDVLLSQFHDSEQHTYPERKNPSIYRWKMAMGKRSK